ncbi:MAG: hypothetical protein ABSB83_00885 [Methanomassiliicoccales archaeon]|jgi:hypothetical protein
MRNVEVNGSVISILPVVKGLVSEEESVADAFAHISPDAVAVSISKEELEGLRRKEDYDKYEPSSLEIAYAETLSIFGKVVIPPPCFVKSLELCGKDSVPIIAIDMDEERFSDTFCDSVGGLDLLRESLFAKKAWKKRFDLSSPESFVIDWDRKVNKAGGFKELERAREKHMAEALTDAARSYKRILAVVEVERVEGVLENMQAPTQADRI